MKKAVIKKLLTVGLVGIRKVCDTEGIDFVKLVAGSVKSKMTVDEVIEYIDNFEEEEDGQSNSNSS